ncbi:hypothetical protein D9758_002187 [Tetrapyrgos nigripes]|uniref:cyclic pyranopterin monophosphate synthase n=1 Tax=Tetrapyrgos nigripes TaxID=182062 RepID=A0A8H5GNY0_9AGAR|nr:hypothetical protein D9758_002187 [Tetrapyrgos nigripes]
MQFAMYGVTSIKQMSYFNKSTGFYCMPEEGVQLTPNAKILTDEEVIRLATLFVRAGVTKIRLTGGEPTVRKGILEIVRDLNSLRPLGLNSIAMTSNGLALHRRLPQLIENGLTHLNLSLDTLDPFKFEFITKRRGHDAVMKALNVALASSELQSVKLNVVVVKGLNDSEVLDFVEMTRNDPVSVRFIEFMPFTGNKWDKAKMVPSSSLLGHITARYPDVIRISDEINDTARSWKVPGYRGTFGFISSMSDHFCSSCNRLRITADGQIKVCLFDAKEVSLRDEMRRGAGDSELLRIIGQAVSGKAEKHVHMEDIDVPMLLSALELMFSILGPGFPVRNASIFTGRRIPSPFYPWHFRQRLPNARLFTHSSAHNSDPKPRLSHLDESGRANMVDVSDKSITKRSATAQGRIYITPVAYELVTSTYPDKVSQSGQTEEVQAKGKAKALRKGDALTVAQLAAIMGSKKTSDLIPLCHPLPLTKVDVSLTPEIVQSSESPAGANRHSILCTATVTCEGKTGVEMEALTAVSVGLLTVWDMLKAVAGKDMAIGDILVTEKSGGRSGDFSRRLDD